MLCCAVPCQVAVNLGILAGYCIGIPYEYDINSVTLPWAGVAVPWWRAMTAVAVLPAVLQVGQPD